MLSPEGAATSFLPVERASPGELVAQVARAVRSPLVDALMRAWPGALAVLNGHRQFLALNDSYLRALGVVDAPSVLGMRPGEAIGCDRASEGPGGCGTGGSCPGCGAAIAIVSALRQGEAREMDCILTVQRDGAPLDVAFRVRAFPLDLDAERLVLLCLTDVSAERCRAALDLAFLHDLANLATGICGFVAWAQAAPAGELPQALAELEDASTRLRCEIQVHRSLGANRAEVPAPRVEAVEVDLLARQLRALFRHHPAAVGRHLDLAVEPGLALTTDPLLLHRILGNMLINAFEASPPGGTVRLAAEAARGAVCLSVWNAGVIPEQSARRIFQRYFTTKEGAGRGQGTFVMKLFGERALGGKVSFSSLAAKGTTFTLALPAQGTQGAPGGAA